MPRSKVFPAGSARPSPWPGRLSNRRKSYLLDEPLAAMGAKESAMIIDLVKDSSRNRKETMIIIDHNHTHLFELCDRLAVIQHGTVTFDKPVKDTSIDELTELMVSSYHAPDRRRPTRITAPADHLNSRPSHM